MTSREPKRALRRRVMAARDALTPGEVASRSAAAAAGRKSARGVTRNFAPSYVDPHLRADAEMLRSILTRAFLQFHEVEAKVTRTQIDLDGDKAIVLITTNIRGIPRGEGDWAPIFPAGELFELTLERLDGKWQIVSVDRSKSSYE